MKREEDDTIIQMDIVPLTAENDVQSHAFANIVIAFGFFTINCNFYLNLHCVRSVQRRSFFCSVVSCIRTEYGDLLSQSLYLVRITQISVFSPDKVNLRIQCKYRKIWTRKNSVSKCNRSKIASLLKRDSNTVVFLWIIRHFWEQLFFTEHLQWLLLNVFQYSAAFAKDCWEHWHKWEHCY